jgi:hypothetical protein
MPPGGGAKPIADLDWLVRTLPENAKLVVSFKYDRPWTTESSPSPGVRSLPSPHDGTRLRFI